MLSVNLATILLAATTVVNAVPVSNVPSLYESGIVSNATTVLNSTAWHKDHILQPHEVILYGANRMEVLHVDTYKALLASKQLFHIDSDVQDALNYTVPPVEAASSEVETATNGTKSLADKRATCPSYTNTVTDTTQHFIGWDVQMSQVVRAVGERTTITVTSGYTVTNGITVGVSGDWTIVKDALKAAFKIDYTRSWSSAYSSAIMGTITEGYTGTMVCNPVTTRRYGRVLKGCIGAQTVSSNFMADSYEEGSHAGLTWVAGVISLCQKKVSGSLTFCEGSGTFK